MTHLRQSLLLYSFFYQKYQARWLGKKTATKRNANQHCPPTNPQEDKYQIILHYKQRTKIAKRAANNSPFSENMARLNCFLIKSCENTKLR